MPIESEALAKGTGQNWIKWLVVTLMMLAYFFLNVLRGRLRRSNLVAGR